MNEESELIIREPDTKATACIIWLHGLGADGHDFASIVEALDVSAEHAIRFIFPHAPVRSVTINDGMMMRAWYDIFSIDKDMQEDATGIDASRLQIESIIQSQLEAEIPASRIILVGFSQGGCIALHTGLRFQQTLGGVLGLSTYLPLRQLVPAELNKNQRTTPIMLMHGTQDQVVNYEFGLMSFKVLADLGLNTEWHEYPMEHTVSNPQLGDISEFISACLRASKA